MKHTIIHLIAITTMGAVSAYAVNDWTLYYELPSSTSQEIVLSSTTGAGSESENGYWYTGSERTPETSMKGWKTEYEDDNFTISALRQSTYYNVRLNLDSDTTFGNLTLSGGGNLTYPIVDAQNHNVSIKRDLILSSDTNYGIHYNSFSIINADTITVGNDIKNIGRSYHINANRIIVNGNITNAEDGTHYIDYIIVRLPIPLRKIPMRSSKGIFPATYFLFIRQLRIPMSKLAA